MSRFALATTLLSLLPSSALAAVVCMTDQNLAVPQDSEGVYINLVTGDNAGSESAVPGFDFDPYAAVSTNPTLQLKFYWGSASNNGAGVASAGDAYAVLAGGDVIDAGSPFTRAGFSGDTSAWQAGVEGYLGMRFTNEATATLTYGWVRLSTTAPLGFPATVLDWCYEDSGAGITIPAAPDDDRVFCDGFDGLTCQAE